MPKLISQVITTDNRGHYLSAAIKSLLNPSKKFLAACLFSLVASLLPSIAASQTIAPDTTDNSTDTNVTPDASNPSIYNIDGGQVDGNGRNLFHSFSQFGLEERQTANFVADPLIQNILGRVTGGNASVINGLVQVSGNANLFLMNPAGFVFGDGARLDVPGAFTATTATRIGFDNNNWFNATGTNDYSGLIGTPSTFDFGISGTPGAIVNSGQLTVGTGQNLALIGGVVVNTGELTAPGGNITIAAVPGQNLVRISQDGHLLSLEISTADALAITPLSLPDLLTGPTDALVAGLTVDTNMVTTNSGVVVPDSAGTVVVSGTVDASTTTLDQTGGSVQLLGNQVGLVDNAQVNASGDAGGGRVLITGESRGQGTAPNSSQIFVESGVTINSDAGSSGNGGQVSVRSDGTTRFYGNINARGAAGTNGGSVEISGQSLSFNGTVNTLGLDGSRGTLLLRSADLSIINAAAVDPPLDSNLGNNPQILFDLTPDPASNILSWEQIAALAPNNNIVLEAMGEIAIADVTLNNLVNLGVEIGNLTIRSTNGSITFEDTNDAIATQGSAIALEAGDSITGGNLITNGGAVTLSAQNGSLTAGRINSGSSSGNGGAVTLNAQNNIIIDSIDTQSANGIGGSVDITTERFFRASGTNSANASISTGGGVQGGSITIQHGGGTFGVPFRVGSDYDDTNGTAGSISIGSASEISSGVFYGGYEEGNSPSNIQIITPEIDSRVLSPLLVGNLQPQPDATDTNSLTTLSLPSVEIDSVFAQLDESFTRQFEQYFGNTVNTPNTNLTEAGGTPQQNEATTPNTNLAEADEAPQQSEAGTLNTSLTQARETLQQVEEQTGLKPALLYAVFVPASISSEAATEGQVPLPTDQLELVLITAQGKPIRRRVEGATRRQVLKIAQEFRSSVTNIRRSRNYLSSSQQLYRWLVAPLVVDLQAEKIDNLVFLMDTGLRSIPIAALHDGQGFLVERYSVSLMPSLRLTDTRYQDIKQAQVLAMGAEKFTDQKPLPAVPVELSLITGQLWRGKSFLNDAFTLENLKAQRQRTPFGIIHLATHADFQPGAPDQSYIQLTNTKLRLNQLPNLGWNSPPVELLVLSACRTALGDEQAELGFAGLAVQAGVKSALASLWYVSDEATLGLMSQFYEQLKSAPSKAEALRQAQLAMLNGQVRIESGNLRDARGVVRLPAALAGLQDKQLTHPYYWAAFTMIGNPW